MDDIISSWVSGDKEIEKVHIFGSRARGKARDNSDIDIAIEFIPKYNDLANWIHRAPEMRNSLQQLLPYDLDLQWYGGPEETPVIHNGLNEGCRTIYQAKI